MAELLDRADKEEAFRTALRQQIETSNELAARYLDQGERPPPVEQEDLFPIIFHALVVAYSASAVTHGMGYSLANRLGATWARPRARAQAARLAEKSQQERQRAIKALQKRAGMAAARRGERQREIRDRLNRGTQVETTVSTEITSAATAGSEDAVSQRRAASGNVNQAQRDLWWTQLDSTVCPICEPLHGTPRTVWSRTFPKGPPAHPNCRCSIEYSESEAERQRGIPKRLRNRMSDGRAIYEEGGLKYTRRRLGDAGKSVVVVDVGKVDQAWSIHAEHRGQYIPPGGGGAEIGDRRAEFRRWRSRNPEEPIEMPDLGPINRVTGAVSFSDGRHRFSVLRDQGVQKIPVLVPRGKAEEFRNRFGA